jgi:HlyD family secretion protein
LSSGIVTSVAGGVVTSVAAGIVPGVVAGIIAIGGVSWFVRTSMKPTGPGPGFVSGNGRIEATEIDVATTLPGRVIEIFANEGDFVTADQPLAQMQIDSLDAQKDEANAQR